MNFKNLILVLLAAGYLKYGSIRAENNKSDATVEKRDLGVIVHCTDCSQTITHHTGNPTIVHNIFFNPSKKFAPENYLSIKNETAIKDVTDNSLINDINREFNVLKKSNSLEKKINAVKFYSSLVEKASKSYNVPENLIYAVIYIESSGDSKAISPKGASGLMGLMPKTANELGVKNVLNPEENINGGTAYLSKQLNSYNGNIVLALIAYNAGPDDADSVVKKYNYDFRWETVKWDLVKETREYVPKVLASRALFDDEKKSEDLEAKTEKVAGSK